MYRVIKAFDYKKPYEENREAFIVDGEVYKVNNSKTRYEVWSALNISKREQRRICEMFDKFYKVSSYDYIDDHGYLDIEHKYIVEWWKSEYRDYPYYTLVVEDFNG